MKLHMAKGMTTDALGVNSKDRIRECHPEMFLQSRVLGLIKKRVCVFVNAVEL